MITNSKLAQMLSDYMKAYPDAEPPTYYFSQFEEDGLLEILEEANGRKVIFTRDPKDAEADGDPVNVSYE